MPCARYRVLSSLKCKKSPNSHNLLITEVYSNVKNGVSGKNSASGLMVNGQTFITKNPWVEPQFE